MTEFKLLENTDNKNLNKTRKFFNCLKNVLLGRKDEKLLTAQEAYFKTKYGDITSLNEYIAAAQNHIALEIKRNTTPNSYTSSNENNFHSCYAIVDFGEDIIPYIEDIFKPFKDNGFKFIPLHNKIKEINNASIWLISWNYVSDQEKHN